MQSVSQRHSNRGSNPGGPLSGGIARLHFAASTFALLAGLAHAEGDPASLDRLHDVVSPPPVSWWPVAPGWYALAAVVTLGVLALLWRARRRSLRDRYRQEALAELAALRAEARSVAGAVAGRMVLLKRTALSAYPRAEVASLSGPAWWRYLDDHVDEALFAAGLGEECEAFAYRDTVESEGAAQRVERFDLAVEQWIRRHHPAPAQETSPAQPAAGGRVEAIGGA